MLYHLLPVVFWLLAIVGSLIPVILQITNHPIPITNSYYWGYLVVSLVLWAIVIVSRIQRHGTSVNECFVIALLLGIASYWLPSVVFLIAAFWVYLIYNNLFSFRSFLSTLIGFATVAIWAVILNQFQIIHYPLQLTYNLWAWLPTGSILLAWLASTIARQILRVR